MQASREHPSAPPLQLQVYQFIENHVRTVVCFLKCVGEVSSRNTRPARYAGYANGSASGLLGRAGSNLGFGDCLGDYAADIAAIRSSPFDGLPECSRCCLGVAHVRLHLRQKRQPAKPVRARHAARRVPQPAVLLRNQAGRQWPISGPVADFGQRGKLL
jgi:hypothetical protein